MDYRPLAIDELSRVADLRVAKTVCIDRLRELTDRMTSLPGTSNPEPVHGGSHSTEDHLLGLIAAKSDEERRLREIRRSLGRFNLAWNSLNDQEQKVLDAFYITRYRNAAEYIAASSPCDRATAFRWRDKALIRFTRSFFGTVIM